MYVSADADTVSIPVRMFLAGVQAELPAEQFSWESLGDPAETAFLWGDDLTAYLTVTLLPEPEEPEEPGEEAGEGAEEESE